MKKVAHQAKFQVTKQGSCEMSQAELYQWCDEIRKHLLGVKKWQALGLALFSIGIVLASGIQQLR